MIKFCNLYSGSSGNCTLVATENTKILIDAGVSNTKIVKALESLKLSIDDIDAILITHEHQDHTKGLKITCKKNHVPVYANEKTWKMMDSLEISDVFKFYFETNKEFTIGDFKIFPFSIPHDAADPCGFSLYAEGKKVTVSTDIGHITDEILHQMEKSDILLLESNYDTDTLYCGPYPYLLKKRISSEVGHLSNKDASAAITHLVQNGVSNVVLGHLSKENNFPELAYQTTYNELQNANAICNLSVAKRDEVDPVISLE